ncbi:hypothetical protein K4H02_27030, partial [Mycobacterium tuberculosis]|nr:hypothetical protein [Mycobacterium tuberculosis]
MPPVYRWTGVLTVDWTLVYLRTGLSARSADADIAGAVGVRPAAVDARAAPTRQRGPHEKIEGAAMSDRTEPLQG